MVAAKARTANVAQRVAVTARARAAVRAVQPVTVPTYHAATQPVAAKDSRRTLHHNAKAGRHVIDAAKVGLKRVESGRVLAMIDRVQVAKIAASALSAVRTVAASAAASAVIHVVVTAQAAEHPVRPTVVVNRVEITVAAQPTAARHAGVGAIAATKAARATVAALAVVGAIRAAVAARAAAGVAQVVPIDVQHRAVRARVQAAASVVARARVQAAASVVARAAGLADIAAARARLAAQAPAAVSAIAMHSPANPAGFRVVAGRNLRHEHGVAWAKQTESGTHARTSPELRMLQPRFAQRIAGRANLHV